jgi:hypothetical protein
MQNLENVMDVVYAIYARIAALMKNPDQTILPDVESILADTIRANDNCELYNSQCREMLGKIASIEKRLSGIDQLIVNLRKTIT